MRTVRDGTGPGTMSRVLARLLEDATGVPFWLELDVLLVGALLIWKVWNHIFLCSTCIDATVVQLGVGRSHVLGRCCDEVEYFLRALVVQGGLRPHNLIPFRVTRLGEIVTQLMVI